MYIEFTSDLGKLPVTEKSLGIKLATNKCNSTVIYKVINKKLFVMAALKHTIQYRIWQ
jgi:hypothetical protein